MTSGGRDVLFLRTFGGLPVPLLTALRGSGLDDAGTLLNYPVDLEDEGERGVPSGATSTAHPSILSSATSSAGLRDRAGETGWSLSDRVVGACEVDMGGDPRTVQFVPSGGEVKTDHLDAGGDPKTDHFVPSGGEVKTDQHVPSGGEVKPDHAYFSVQTAGVSTENADSPHLGGVGSPNCLFCHCFSHSVQKFAMNCRAVRRNQNISMSWQVIPCILMDFRALQNILKFVMDFRARIIWISRKVQKVRDLHLFSAFPKTPNDSASRIQEFKSCPPVAAHPS